MARESERKEISKLLLGGLSFIVIVIFVMILLGYFLWKSVPSADKEINKLEEAIETKDIAKLEKVLNPQTTNMNMDEHALKAFIAYYHEEDNEREEMLAHLRKQAAEKSPGIEEGYFVNMERKKRGFIFNQYEIVASPVYFEFELYYPGGNVYVDDQLVYTYKRDDEDEEAKKSGPFLPGLYTFTAVYDSPVKKFTAKTDTQLPLKANETQIIPFEFDDWKSISLYQYEVGLDEYKLFLEGEDTGEVLTDFHYNLLVDPESTHLKAYIEGEFPWGTMQSEEVELAEAIASGKPRFYADAEMEAEIVDVIKHYNEKRPEFIASMDKELIQAYATNVQANKLLYEIEELKEKGKQYSGEFFDFSYFPGTMSIKKTVDGQFAVLVVAEEHLAESLSKKKNVKPKEKQEMVMYQLNYDTETKSWLIRVVYEEDIIDEFFPDTNFEKMESKKIKATKSKLYQSDW